MLLILVLWFFESYGHGGFRSVKLVCNRRLGTWDVSKTVSLNSGKFKSVVVQDSLVSMYDYDSASMGLWGW